jgi:hypothetical protein
MHNYGLNTYQHKTEETGKYYEITKGKATHYDREMEVKNWNHPAKQVKIIEAPEESPQYIHANTDRSKREVGFGSAIAFFSGSNL